MVTIVNGEFVSKKKDTKVTATKETVTGSTENAELKKETVKDKKTTKK